MLQLDASQVLQSGDKLVGVTQTVIYLSLFHNNKMTFLKTPSRHVSCRNPLSGIEKETCLMCLMNMQIVLISKVQLQDTQFQMQGD